jgi:ribosomal protein S18 acetylase RimI-like enzyme
MATVRTATPADADAIGQAHVEAWQAAYAEVMDADHLAGLDPAARADAWRARLADLGDDLEVSVIVEGGAVQGFVLLGEARPESVDGLEAPGPLGEVHAINLRPGAWGRGLGDRLLEAAEQALARRGVRTAVLWVIASNDRARRLYDRRGWVADGASRTERIGAADVEEVRYRRELP